MKLFNNLFKRKKKTEDFDDFVDDIIRTMKDDRESEINEIEKRYNKASANGKLPAPDIIADYTCECGSKNSFHLKNMNIEAGHDVYCAHCGAVLHVPPTILDHSEYWQEYHGASLVTNWRDQLKFKKHGEKSSLLDYNEIDSTKKDSIASKNELTNKHNFKILEKIKLGTFQNIKEMKKAFKGSDFKLDENAVKLIEDSKFKIASKEMEMKIVVASLDELGFSDKQPCYKLFTLINDLGYSICPAEVGPQLCLQISKQKLPKWMTIAMDPIKNSKGDSYVFEIYNSDNPIIRTVPFMWHGYYGYVHYPDNKLVFINNS